MLLKGRLELDDNYAGFLLGCQGNSIRKRYDRIWTEGGTFSDYEKLFSMYKASGENRNAQLEAWLKFNACIEFRDIDDLYACIMHLPYECVPETEKYVLVECAGINASVSEKSFNGTLQWGNQNIELHNGMAEIPLVAWRKEVSGRREGKLCLTSDVCGDLELYPCLNSGMPPMRQLTDDMLHLAT